MEWDSLPPCIHGKKIVEQNTKQTEGSFTSVQMVHTHISFHNGGLDKNNKRFFPTSICFLYVEKICIFGAKFPT